MTPIPGDDPAQTDRYEALLFQGCNDDEVSEIRQHMEAWNQATYPTLAQSVIDHADRHDFYS